ncbi:hypothetical protein [Actinacidiphila glaucinigra]|uniref:Integral membrane protein n=1 Tax=Actinacidiphila glaucinigra TaxID=235986 RepID=A0A239LNI2_9ACTN|nr:hypothetical protein [Actinacidiphila glaucinigra]SNT31174.1 hypothetical protein SAMN05216252_12084 [Actinacidiphila glaucinigra]
MISPTPATAPGGRTAAALRFTTELVAWVATPWALSGHSWLLAALSVVVLIGLPTVFATPGDKAQVIVPVPGAVTVALVLLQLGAAVVSSWAAWPTPVAALVSVLAAAAVVAETPRWRWLTGNGFGPGADTP